MNTDAFKNKLHELGHLTVCSECDDQLCSVARSIDLQPFAHRARAIGNPPAGKHVSGDGTLSLSFPETEWAIALGIDIENNAV